MSQACRTRTARGSELLRSVGAGCLQQPEPRLTGAGTAHHQRLKNQVRHDLDAHNVRLARAMQRDGRIFLAPAAVDGRACLRACFVNFRTTPAEVPLVLEVAEELGGT